MFPWLLHAESEYGRLLHTELHCGLCANHHKGLTRGFCSFFVDTHGQLLTALPCIEAFKKQVLAVSHDKEARHTSSAYLSYLCKLHKREYMTPPVHCSELQCCAAGHSIWEKQAARSVVVGSHGSAVHPPAKSEVQQVAHPYRSLDEEEAEVGFEDEEHDSQEQKAAEELVSRRRALAKQRLPANTADGENRQAVQRRGRPSNSQQSEEIKR